MRVAGFLSAAMAVAAPAWSPMQYALPRFSPATTLAGLRSQLSGLQYMREWTRRDRRHRAASVVVRQVPPEVFFADAAAFDRLLAGGDQDTLFNGHAWQSSWWDAFGQMHALEPVLLEARDPKGELIGRLALVRRRARDLRLPVTTLELLGNIWRGPATLRSEFLDLVAARDHRGEVAHADREHVFRELRWDEWVLQDLDGASALPEPCVDGQDRSHWSDRLRRTAASRSGLTETSRDFKRRLSSNARRKLFAQRAKLESVGPVAIIREPMESASALAESDACTRCAGELLCWAMGGRVPRASFVAAGARSGDRFGAASWVPGNLVAAAGEGGRSRGEPAGRLRR